MAIANVHYSFEEGLELTENEIKGANLASKIVSEKVPPLGKNMDKENVIRTIEYLRPSNGFRQFFIRDCQNGKEESRRYAQWSNTDEPIELRD